ncbi:ORF2 [Macrobrachium rosenbergii Golda virus]|uniref:ORF2 n=1 Tax=Macrobrachium rosenbergii Golda virus TaxID=2783683 RepID=A0AAE7NDM8_9NIDO|nr:ORF2 [Macrobrachium rosenbergii Golda virus]QOW03297.1 ORF2 [Macrobrachium rosenbergii Golda virus]ULE28631.1 ORF2 protein [Macrobrachium rosenbergii Golda virus]
MSYYANMGRGRGRGRRNNNNQNGYKQPRPMQVPPVRINCVHCGHHPGDPNSVSTGSITRFHMEHFFNAVQEGYDFQLLSHPALPGFLVISAKYGKMPPVDYVPSFITNVRKQKPEKQNPGATMSD